MTANLAAMETYGINMSKNMHAFNMTSRITEARKLIRKVPDTTPIPKSMGEHIVDYEYDPDLSLIEDYLEGTTFGDEPIQK